MAKSHHQKRCSVRSCFVCVRCSMFMHVCYNTSHYFRNIIRLTIYRSSHVVRLHLNFTRNSIPVNGRTTCIVHAGIIRDDRELFHHSIGVSTNKQTVPAQCAPVIGYAVHRNYRNTCVCDDREIINVIIACAHGAHTEMQEAFNSCSFMGRTVPTSENLEKIPW